jgi:ATP-dependent RNA helicase HelY
VPAVVGEVGLPSPFAPHSSAFQRRVAEALHRLPARSPKRGRRHDSDQAHDPRGSGRNGSGSQSAGAGTAAAAGDGPSWKHPVADCPDRDDHLRAVRQAARATREIGELKSQVESRTESLARTFDRVLQLLEAWGYLKNWSLTSRGERLVRVYHESDLLIAEALETGLLDDLDPASLAGLVSCFTYEHRSPVPAPAPWYPSSAVRQRVTEIEKLAAGLNADEQRLRLPLTRPPQPAFFALAHAWAAGESLDHVLDDEDLSGGDFVRNIKQLIDLLRQIGDAAPRPATARAAREAAGQIFRGVVAVSSTIGRAEEAEESGAP